MSGIDSDRSDIFRAVTLVMVCGGLWLAPASAAAKPTWKEIAAANQAAAQGRKAEAQGDFAAALLAYEKSGELQDSAANRRRLARAKAGLGRLLDAKAELEHVLNDSKAPRLHQGKAKQELELLTARIPSVELVIPTDFDGAIEIDDKPHPVTETRVSLDPGKHSLRATSKGFVPFTLEFELAEREAKTVNVELTPLPKAAAGPVKAEPEPSASSPAVRTLGYVSLGVGLVGVAVGGYFGLKARSTREDLREACPNDQCPANLQGKFDDGTAQASYSTIGFVVGGAFLAGGALMLLLSPSQQEAAANRPRVRPLVGLGSFGVDGRF